ncbi:MAG: tetratricopeptide repeat protein [Chitinophagales bacterium]
MIKLKQFTFIIFLSLLNLQLVGQENQGQLDVLNQKIEKGNPTSELYFKRAEIYNEQDNFDKASADYLKIIDNYNSGEDKDADLASKAYYHLAHGYMNINNDESNALKHAVKGLDIDPDHKGLLSIKAEILYGMGQNKKAFEIYESLISEHPDDIEILTAYAQKAESHNPAKAKELYEKILTVDASNNEALYFLGMHYAKLSNRMYQKGDDKKLVHEKLRSGLGYLEKYQKQNPDDEQIILNIITFYRFLGEEEKADKLSEQTNSGQ